MPVHPAAERAAFEARFTARRIAKDSMAIYQDPAARQVVPRALLANAAE